MRIFSPQLGLSPKSILGGEIYDYQTLKNLARMGVKIEILLPKGKDYGKREKNWTINYLPIKHIPAILFSFILLPYLFITFQRKEFDILRLHCPYFSGLAAFVFKIFNPKVKVVAVYHLPSIGLLGDFFNKLFIKSWDFIITDSFYVRKLFIKRYKVQPCKIETIYNGAPWYLKPLVKPKKFVKKFLTRGKIVLLFMGLLIERKNPLFLLKVFKKLKKVKSNVFLILYGQGNQEETLREYIKMNKLADDVMLQKPVFGKEKLQLYNLADIFVHPAIQEGLPLVVLEAMACNLPVVITKGYSASEMIGDGKNGFLARKGNINDWQRKILALVENETLRQKMGRESRKMVLTRFSWKKAALKHKEIFEKLR